jgi:hypothetical protein
MYRIQQSSYALVRSCHFLDAELRKTRDRFRRPFAFCDFAESIENPLHRSDASAWAAALLRRQERENSGQLSGSCAGLSDVVAASTSSQDEVFARNLDSQSGRERSTSSASRAGASVPTNKVSVGDDH